MKDYKRLTDEKGHFTNNSSGKHRTKPSHSAPSSFRRCEASNVRVKNGFDGKVIESLRSI
jgi:hypothetical protein